jgi:hypothetical protein
MSTARRPGLWPAVHGVYAPSLNVHHWSHDLRLRFKLAKGYVSFESLPLAQDSTAERCPCHPISMVEQGTREAPWPVAGRAPNSTYDAPNFYLILSMQSRQWEDSILLTSSGENSQGKADNAQVAQAFCNGSGGGFRWCSGSRNSSGSGDGGRSSSSKRWIGAGSFDVMGRWWRWGLVVLARCDVYRHREI